MRTLRNTPFLLVSLLLSVTASASSGDRSDIFQACVSRCETELCKGSSTLPLALRLTRWTCSDDCRYTCMHAITDHSVHSREDRVHQYFGKWPFWRFAGMQEPASVLFSLFNLWAHIQGFKMARAKISQNHPMRWYYLGWGLVNINAWCWSAVFHTRGAAVVRVEVEIADNDILRKIHQTLKSWITSLRAWRSSTRCFIPSSVYFICMDNRNAS